MSIRTVLIPQKNKGMKEYRIRLLGGWLGPGGGGGVTAPAEIHLMDFWLA